MYYVILQGILERVSLCHRLYDILYLWFLWKDYRNRFTKAGETVGARRKMEQYRIDAPLHIVNGGTVQIGKNHCIRYEREVKKWNWRRLDPEKERKTTNRIQCCELALSWLKRFLFDYHQFSCWFLIKKKIEQHCRVWLHPQYTCRQRAIWPLLSGC